MRPPAATGRRLERAFDPGSRPGTEAGRMGKGQHEQEQQEQGRRLQAGPAGGIHGAQGSAQASGRSPVEAHAEAAVSP